MKKLLTLFACLSAIGCASVPYNPDTVRTLAANELNTAVKNIRIESLANYAFVPINATRGSFQKGAYIQGPDSVLLLNWDTTSDKWIKAANIPLSRVESISIVRHGIRDHLRQLQLKTEMGLVVVNCRSVDSGFDSTVPENEAAYSQLVRAGVKEASAQNLVLPATTGAIPIIISK